MVVLIAHSFDLLSISLLDFGLKKDCVIDIPSSATSVSDALTQSHKCITGTMMDTSDQALLTAKP